MTLIKSISGIRGTIGGHAGDALTPIDVVEFVSAYSALIKKEYNRAQPTIVIGRDARISGPMVANLAINTMLGMGIHVIDLGLSTTPTVEVNVTRFKAQGGIIITASHNPKQWNALKFLNHHGEFISAEWGETILESIANKSFHYADVDQIGSLKSIEDAVDYHVDQILADELIDVEKIKAQEFKIVIDAINSTGALIKQPFESKLNCEVIVLNDDLSGEFAHNPEPLPEHIVEILETVKQENADIGFVVDPDVDRLGVIDEKGQFIGEENTIITLADFLLPKSENRVTVSNLSSSRGLQDITYKHGGEYYASAVGEVNVVKKLKEVNGFFGGEGNGGVIFPRFHAGRDGILGMILYLQMLAETQSTVSQLTSDLPVYHMTKSKIQLDKHTNVGELMKNLEHHFQAENIDTTDGIKVNRDNHWIHIRRSNTEPIIRLYMETPNQEMAKDIESETKQIILNLIG